MHDNDATNDYESDHDSIDGAGRSVSPDPEITFNNIESRLNSKMSAITGEIQKTLMTVTDQIEDRLSQFDTRIRSHENQSVKLGSGLGPQVNSGDRPHSLNDSHVTHNDHGDDSDRNSNSYSANRPVHNWTRGDNSNIKMKPQHFQGTEDLIDFLTQFEITAEINGWNYRAKSLYLANSLTGGARSLLNELSPFERRDFDSLVTKLKSRYGSEGRAEVFRTQLKSRVRNKNETISELAQSIKKLTRQAYPSANAEIVEALALDAFIDALTDSEIRLRLREIGAKSLDEAEKTAVRMEAHRIADRQRYKSVCTAVGQNRPTESNKSPAIDILTESVKNLSTKLDKLLQDPPTQRYQNQYPGSNNVHQGRNNYVPHRNRYVDQFSQNDRYAFNQPRGGNPYRHEPFSRQNGRGGNPNGLRHNAQNVAPNHQQSRGNNSNRPDMAHSQMQNQGNERMLSYSGRNST